MFHSPHFSSKVASSYTKGYGTLLSERTSPSAGISRAHMVLFETFLEKKLLRKEPKQLLSKHSMEPCRHTTSNSRKQNQWRNMKGKNSIKHRDCLSWIYYRPSAKRSENQINSTRISIGSKSNRRRSKYRAGVIDPTQENFGRKGESNLL